MWTDENRPRYNRDHLRYPSDTSDEEWALIAPLIPAAKRGGRRREVDIRAVFNGITYVLSTGCQWRYVPKEKARFMITSACGVRTAHWIAFIKFCMRHVVHKRSASANRPLASSIARA